MNSMDLDLLNAVLSLLYPLCILFVIVGAIYFLYYLAKTAVERKIKDEIEKSKSERV